MPVLTRDEVKKIVEDCLRKIADFDGKVEKFKLTGAHKKSLNKFTGCIARRLRGKRITVPLSVSFLEGTIKEDKTIGYLIKHIDDRQKYRPE